VTVKARRRIHYGGQTSPPLGRCHGQTGVGRVSGVTAPARQNHPVLDPMWDEVSVGRLDGCTEVLAGLPPQGRVAWQWRMEDDQIRLYSLLRATARIERVRPMPMPPTMPIFSQSQSQFYLRKLDNGNQ